MSRRKQSNPKPLKGVDEEWTEEGKRQIEKENGKQESEDQNGPKDETSVTEKNEIKSEPPERNHIKVPLFPSSKPDQEIQEQESNPCSNLAETREERESEHNSETEECDDRRKRRRESESSGSQRKSPDLADIDPETNRGLISSQQILQGLPYLHLLPQSIRNDVGRLLFMPPVLPPELSGNVTAPVNGSSELEKGPGENSRTGVGYFCKPCGIKFSSARTLEAHQTYYCSFRRELENEASGKCELESEKVEPSGKKRERGSGGEGDREVMSEESMEISQDADVNPNKTAKTGKLYACMYCSYSADKKVSLNRHMRMHSGSTASAPSSHSEEPGPASGTTTPVSNVGLNKNLPEGVNALERYCQDCDIQFSSIKTYRVHKQYYCRTRHVMKHQTVTAATGSPPRISVKSHSHSSASAGDIVSHPGQKNSGSPVPSDASPASTPGPMSSQPLIVLPTNPLIVVPYCIIQAATILPGNVMPSQNALVVLPNGSIQGLPFTSVSLPIPSPMASLLSPFPSGVSLKNGGASGSNISPNNQSHSVFNDPKDMLRKMSSVTKHEIRTSESKSGLRTPDDDNIQADEEIQSEEENKITDGKGRETKLLESDEGLDLTLRKTNSSPTKDNNTTADEEKENREVHSVSSVAGSSGRKSSTSVSEHNQHRDKEMCSPTERPSSGGGSCGKRTPRPSSASISSSACSTPPGLCEPKLNGVVPRLSPMSMECDADQNPNVVKGHPLMAMMMGSGKEPVDFSGAETTKGKYKLPTSDAKGKSGRISHIATQLPGGAILSAAGGQTLTDLLMPNSPEFSELISKISPHLLVNSRSVPPMGLNPALIQALSQSDPELLMRMLDPNYLATLQQNLQLHNQHQQQHLTAKRGYSKCVECDIVFYKHENYLVHKEHYCAARVPNGSSPAMQSSRKDSSSRISSCSSPGKSEGDEDINSPRIASTTSAQSQGNIIKSSRKSTDSCSSDFFPAPMYEKYKSRSPQGNSSATVSISPIPSPIERKDKPGSGSQYPCVHCGVKYSTLDNLKAHQTFYCTKLRNMKESGIPQSEGSEIMDVNVKQVSTGKEMQIMDEECGPSGIGQPFLLSSKGLLQCGKCKLAIPEDQLSSHNKICLGSNGSSVPYGGIVGLMGEGGRNLGWKCPCCDTYSPTVSQAQKHLECHTGIKAFRCLLCGYRGNTLRGMRTHIRTHFDKRVSDLLEGEYMTCITANDVEHHSSVSSPFSANKLPESNRNLSTFSESSNNRHSSMEKVKPHHSPGTSNSSPGSPGSSQDVKLFPSEYDLSDTDKLENNNRVSKCTLCNYISPYRGHIIRHMKMVHKIPEDRAESLLLTSVKVENEMDHCSENLGRKLNSDIKDAEGNSIGTQILSNNGSPSSPLGMGVTLFGKKKNKKKNTNGEDEGESGERNCRSSSTEKEQGTDSLNNKDKACAVKYCKSCDHLSTFDAHTKSYCSATLNNKAPDRAETPVQ